MPNDLLCSFLRLEAYRITLWIPENGLQPFMDSVQLDSPYRFSFRAEAGLELELLFNFLFHIDFSIKLRKSQFIRVYLDQAEKMSSCGNLCSMLDILHSNEMSAENSFASISSNIFENYSGTQHYYKHQWNQTNFTI